MSEDHSRGIDLQHRTERDKPQCLVIIPAYGRVELTHAVLSDIRAQASRPDVLVVDNGGGYVPLGGEEVIRPKANIGWAGASNLGFRVAFSSGYRVALTLNNDTRLSSGFFDGVLDPRLPGDIGLLSPLYDQGSWGAQVSEYKGPASQYRPRDYYRSVAGIDGTAMAFFADAWAAVGDLDCRTFGKFAWGADVDLCIRVREAGFGIYVTERSFVNHLGKVSASECHGRRRYTNTALLDMRRGMRRQYGRYKLAELKHVEAVRYPLRDRFTADLSG
jgi:GT2 family glycosyltransferase